MYNTYIVHLQANGKSNRTIHEYINYVKQMLNYIGKPEKEITIDDLEDWRSSITYLSSNSQRLQIAAVKSYFRFLMQYGVIDTNPAEGMVPPTPKAKEKACPKSWMLRAMVENAPTRRDKAMILMFATTGLRFDELTNIKLSQYLDMEGESHREITIVGKGSKPRKVYVNDETKSAIDEYLKNRNTDSDILFASHQGNHIKNNNFNQALKSIAKKAGIPFWQDVTAHWLRVSFATIKASENTPLNYIQAALGHSSIKTTMRYIKNSQEDINNIMSKTSF